LICFAFLLSEQLLEAFSELVVLGLSQVMPYVVLLGISVLDYNQEELQSLN
jgi:hypothetical protein